MAETPKNSGNLIDILQDVIKRKQIPQENIKSAQWLQNKIRNFRRNLNVKLDDSSMSADQFMEGSNLIQKRRMTMKKLYHIMTDFPYQ